MFKIFCGHLVEASRFFHQIESKHVAALNFDINESVDSNELAESVDYAESVMLGSDAGSILMGSDEKKNLMDQTSLAESHIVSEPDVGGESQRGDGLDSGASSVLSEVENQGGGGDDYDDSYEEENEEQAGRYR